MRDLILKGVRQNNLKDIDLSLPLGRAIIVTGPSGSGKSSLAFDTIYAEGQRRYMQSLSTYARQFLEKFKAPLVDKMQNIPPTIALEQLNPVRNSRTTVGTTTEIYDYLRLLFEKLGIEYCPDCQIPMEKLTYTEIVDRIARDFEGKTILVAFTKTLPPTKEVAADFLREMLRSGYSRLVYKNKVETVEDLVKGNIPHGKSVDIVIDRIRLPSGAEAVSSMHVRIGEAVRNAMGLGDRVANILTETEKGYSKVRDFTNQSRCPNCKRVSAPKSAISFSFNSPLGACQTCNGFGNTLELDEDKVVPSPNLSVSRGAVDPFTKPSLNHWQKKLLAFCKEARIDISVPWKDLPENQRNLILDGDKRFKGVRGVFRMLEKDKYKMRIRVFLSRYNSPFLCPTCKGARLGEGPLRVRIADKNIAQVSEMTIESCHQFLRTINFSERERTIAVDILRQIDRRLDYLSAVGLGYLTLSRLGRSLSGGEYQRILLATQLSQGLTDTMYVLDEPSIGLHPKDTQRLITVLNRLREQGNSLVVVEHDPEVIAWGEYIVDLGPGAGKRGGEIVFSGSRESFVLSDTQTSRAVRDWKLNCRKALDRPARERAEDWIDIRGASANNLQNVDVSIPLKRLVVITGVSGSGKSTLIVDTLYQALAKIFHAASDKIGKFESIAGFEHLGGIELVDQSPIGKSSRSNPITFIKAYDEIRQLFAQTREAVAKRLTPGHFSFNVPGGRCEECEGEGRTKVDMVFMEDIWVPCQTCDEKRFKASILAIRYRGKNIDDCLRMTVDEAYDFFKTVPGLKAKLALLQEVGLGYIQLGQPGFSLSGGEAQRLKIARELSSGSLRKPNTLFIFDEPTTGLHFEEISKLIGVLRRLISSGHSVVVIEHNVQLICSADFLIDLGPDGGSNGGCVVAVGPPKELAQKKLPHTGAYLAEILEQ